MSLGAELRINKGCGPAIARSRHSSWASRPRFAAHLVNPAIGAVQTKMPYVVKVDSLYLGCGVYKSVAQAAA
jgi:hypothetical protein